MGGRSGVATIQFLPAARTVRARTGDSLLDTALEHGVPLDHACGGCGSCATCHVIVWRGGDLLSAPEEDETERLDSVPLITGRSRLGCQAVVTGDGDLVVEVPPRDRRGRGTGVASPRGTE